MDSGVERVACGRERRRACGDRDAARLPPPPGNLWSGAAASPDADGAGAHFDQYTSSMKMGVVMLLLSALPVTA